jgi:hypothetical protein
MLLSLLFLQAAAAQAGAPLPDIELNIHARARSVEIEQKGEAKLEIVAEPDAGSRVDVRVEPRSNGRTSLRNVQVDIKGEARIGEGVEISAEAETTPPQ